jgi:catechol 2,3-dioxygenase-like lactoylglutathione lyase family enzyme
MSKITGSNVTVMVKNMNKAIKFYQNLGLKLQQRWGNHYAMIGTKGLTLGIHPSKDKKNSSGNLSIGLMVKDIKTSKALLDKHKIRYKFFNDGNSGLYLHFKDLDGTLLYFMQPTY